jgi:hypothetical protein
MAVLRLETKFPGRVLLASFCTVDRSRGIIKLYNYAELSSYGTIDLIHAE